MPRSDQSRCFDVSSGTECLCSIVFFFHQTKLDFVTRILNQVFHYLINFALLAEFQNEVLILIGFYT